MVGFPIPVQLRHLSPRVGTGLVASVYVTDANMRSRTKICGHGRKYASLHRLWANVVVSFPSGILWIEYDRILLLPLTSFRLKAQKVNPLRLRTQIDGFNCYS